MEQIKKREQVIKNIIIQIGRMFFIFYPVGVEKQIQHRKAVVRVDAGIPGSMATIVDNETRAAPG